MKCSKCSKQEADRSVTVERGKTKITIMLCGACAVKLKKDMNDEQ